MGARHAALMAAWIAAGSSGAAVPFAPHAVTSTRGRGPCTASLPVTVSADGVSVPGLKLPAVSVPATVALPENVALPATLRLPPSARLNAEIALPLVEPRSGGRITSGYGCVPLVPWPV